MRKMDRVRLNIISLVARHRYKKDLPKDRVYISILKEGCWSEMGQLSEFRVVEYIVQVRKFASRGSEPCVRVEAYI